MVVKAIWHLLRIAVFDFGTRRSFRDYMIAFAWLIAIAALYVSMPHTQEVLMTYEGGSHDNQVLKSWSMTLIIELTAGALFLIALHAKGLADEQRKNIATFSVPFYILTGELQAAYYFHISHEDWVRIAIAAQLALVLPYCTFVSTNIIGYLLSTAKELSAAVKAFTSLKLFGFNIVEAREVGQELEQTRLQVREQLAHQPTQVITIPDPENAQALNFELLQARNEIIQLNEQVQAQAQAISEQLSLATRNASPVIDEAMKVVNELQQKLERAEASLNTATTERDHAKAEAHALAEANRPLLEKLRQIEHQTNVKPLYPRETVREEIGRLFTRDTNRKINSDQLADRLGEIWQELWAGAAK